MDETGESARIGDVSGTSSGYERSPTFKRQKNRKDEINVEDNPDDVPDEAEEMEVIEEAIPPGPFVNPEFYLRRDQTSRWYLEPQVAQTSCTPRFLYTKV
ncbi:hypothetical protein J6590_099699 [Homalodisca vitripennis]|nr:hypothetical protein J6590_099699 [Homalodisca vitripennis]